MYKKCLVIFILLITLSFSAYSQDTNIIDNISTETNINQEESTNIAQEEPQILRDIREMQVDTAKTNNSMFVRAIFGFIVTLLGIYFIFIYFRKRSKKVLGSDNIISVLATTPVAPNRYISIVEIVGEMYLIAVADHSITLLSKIEDKETRDQIRMSFDLSKSNVVEDSFKTIFNNTLLKFREPKVEDKNPLESSAELKERLKDIGRKK